MVIFYAGLNSIMWQNLPHQKALKLSNDFSFPECCFICAEQKPSCVQEFCQQRFCFFNYFRGERQLNAEVHLVSPLQLASSHIKHGLPCWVGECWTLLSLGPHLCSRNYLRWCISNRRPGLSYFVPRSYLIRVVWSNWSRLGHWMKKKSYGNI